MRMHTQNLSYGRLATWRYGRAWIGPLHVEWSVFRDTQLLMAGVWSSGFNLYARWFGLFVNVGNSERQRGRWGVSWSDGVLRIEHPWVRKNEWRSADPWWRKDLSLRIVDWLIGRSRCDVTTGDPLSVVVPMPEGCYRATATKETRAWRRRWYWPERRAESVTLSLPVGIPFAGKGENSWDCGDDGLYGIGGDTVEDAIANAVRTVLRSRRRYGFDSMGSGREPILAPLAARRPDA